MKKALLVFTLIFAVGFTVMSCKKEKKEEVEKEMATVVYQCPMDCEKGKSYTKEGSCPVCKMELKEKKPGEKSEHKEGDGHGH